MIETYTASTAPRNFLSLSPFARDERCSVVDVVVGDTYNEVVLATLNKHSEALARSVVDEQFFIVDWDHTQDDVTGKYLGFTVRDNEPTPVD